MIFCKILTEPKGFMKVNTVTALQDKNPCNYRLLH